MNKFIPLLETNAKDFEFKFGEFYRVHNSDRLGYDVTSCFDDFDVSTTIYPTGTCVHYMGDVIIDESLRESVHVMFRADEETGYTVTLYKMVLEGEERDYIEEFDAINNIPALALRRTYLDIETLTKMAELAVEVVEIIKKDETVQRNVL